MCHEERRAGTYDTTTSTTTTWQLWRPSLISDLQATPILLMNFRVNCSFRSGDEVQIKFSRWWLGRPSWISESLCRKGDLHGLAFFSILSLLCHFVFDFCLHNIPYWDNGHSQFHRRKSPLQKLSGKRVKYHGKVSDSNKKQHWTPESRGTEFKDNSLVSVTAKRRYPSWKLT